MLLHAVLTSPILALGLAIIALGKNNTPLLVAGIVLSVASPYLAVVLMYRLGMLRG